MMKDFIDYIHIHNFKSIHDLKLENCKRINLFIGYPNVGKSNVLEALSLFSVPFLEQGENLNKLVRAENKNELFYNASDTDSNIETNLETITMCEETFTELFSLKRRRTQLLIDEKKVSYYFTSDLQLSAIGFGGTDIRYVRNNIVKKYAFSTKNQWKSTGDSQLLPPFGENLIDVLSYNKDLVDVKAWMKQEFAKYGLEYILDKSSNSLKIQRRLGGDEVFQLPYSSIADTLQRIIFYRTAIASNKNSVLLFEEPEAHAFPPYIKTITQDVIDSTSNQFFIVTHSPLILNDFIEYGELRKEVAIYLFDFKDGQTIAKRLSDEEMDEVYNYGEDLFFNLEIFL